MQAKLEAALAWAERGFRVFPLRENGTKPIWEGWTETATTEPTTIRAWWEGSDYNIGVCTTGLLVVDIDVKQGRPGMASWMQVHGGFDTLTVRTRSGGYHLYYWGADVAINQGALGEGLDIRSHHGYVVAPGSVVDGAGYSVELDLPMERAPQHIVARCKPPGHRAEHAAFTLVEHDTPTAIRMAVQKIETTEGAVRGEQSERAYKLACALRDYGVSEAMCATLMDVWAARCSPPIAPDDLRGRIANAYAYAQNPGGAKHPEVAFGQIILPEPPALLPAPEHHALASLGMFGNAIAMRDLQPRPHVLKGLLLRREITALLSPGGVGKSLVTLVIAAHLALGLDWLGHENVLRAPAKSIVYDAEDSLSEMSMRLHAICTALNFDFEQVMRRVALISGKDHGRIRLVGGGQVPQRNDEACAALVQAASDPEVAMLALNPLNKLHTCNGIDNIAMTYVMDVLEAIAERADVALFLAHHTSKPQSGVRRSGNADTAQGASAVKDSARIVVTLNPPEDEDVGRYGLSPTERRLFLRLDGAKMNRTLAADEALWLRKVPVRLWNGEEVGALDQADMHARTEQLRQMIARALVAGMTGVRGEARVKLADAAALVKAGEPILEKLPASVIKQRIQSNLAEPVVLPDGSRLQCVEQAGSWFVILE